MSQLVGVTVMPEYIQYEGIEPVLDRLQAVGVTAVATSPYVLQLEQDGSGGREPPIDAGAGEVRLLDRPLWGRRELWVSTAPSFQAQSSLYQGLRYQPPPATKLTAEAGPLIGRFLDAARARGMQGCLQVQAAIPPGYRVQFGGPHDDDLPLLPNGRVPARRVANNASLASPHLWDYQRALIADLQSHYPQVASIRFDWPEYPPYLLDSVFLDFSPHARRAAEQWGLDFELMQRDSLSLYDQLHGGLTNDDLEFWRQGAWAAAQVLVDRPGLALAMQLKARLSEQLLRIFRESLDPEIELAPSAFPPPWSLVSGMDLRRAAAHCGSVSVKLYGMHWAMILHFYGRQLLAANPRLDERRLVQALVGLLGIADDEGLESLDDYSYPEPNQPHPAGPAAQRRKIQQAQLRAGDLPVHVLAHGYGPVDDFAARAAVALEASPHGVWFNRYGYLSDEKLQRLGQLLQGR